MIDRPSRLIMGLTMVCLVLIWGTTWGAIRLGLEGLPPLTGVALRFTIAGVLLFGIARAKRVEFSPTRRSILVWGTNGLFSFCISYGLVYWAEQWVPSGLASVLWSTFPFHVAIVAHFLLPEERLTWQGVLGIVLGFGGVLLLFSEDLDGIGGPGVARAATWLLVSPFAAAIGNVAVKKWGKGLHHLSVTSVPMLLTGGVMGGLAGMFEGDRSIDWTPTAIGALLYLAIFGSAITFSLYFWLLRHVAAVHLSLIAYVIPVVALTIGALFLEETLTVRLVLGSLVVLIGVAIASRPAAIRRAAPS